MFARNFHRDNAPLMYYKLGNFITRYIDTNLIKIIEH